MFTGIITHTGIVAKKTENRLTITVEKKLGAKLALGTSISVNGICLTVVDHTPTEFTADFMPETAKRTTIYSIGTNDLVNLELPATPTTFLAGHIVQGHVDAVATLKSIDKNDNSQILTFSIPQNVARYIVEKGSIAVNGISLTVIEANETYFTVGIIPHTWKVTMLHKLQVGQEVNIEVDILAKYIERLMQK